MINPEVLIIEPGITNNGGPAWETPCAADVYINKPVTIGAELGRFIGGTAIECIIISEVGSTTEGSHVIVAAENVEFVEQAVNRLRTYFRTEPSQLGMLRKTFAEEPLSNLNPRQI